MSDQFPGLAFLSLNFSNFSFYGNGIIKQEKITANQYFCFFTATNVVPCNKTWQAYNNAIL